MPRTVVVRHQYDADRTEEIGRATLQGGRAVLSGFPDDMLEELERKGIPEMVKGKVEFVPLSDGNRFLDALLMHYKNGYTVASEERARN
jgi:hypothetical protein